METVQQLSTDQEVNHFDDLIEEGEELEKEAEFQAVQSNMIDAEGFHVLFCEGFTITGVFTRLESLKVDKNNAEARACTQALYETILETPSLHFILMPQGKWLGRVMAIGAFALPMALNVADELNTKATAQKSPVQEVDEPLTGTIREMAAQQEGEQ